MNKIKLMKNNLINLFFILIKILEALTFLGISIEIVILFIT